jgi:hypothetical protein
MWPFKRKKWEALGIPLTSDELRDKLKMFTDTIYLRDGKYRAIPYKDFEYLFTMKREESPKYRDDIMDCDDHCSLFIADIKRAWADLSEGNEALAFGYISGTNADGENHAWIWQMDDNLSLNMVEAQTNRKMKGIPKDIRMIEG